jgi:serine/threonine-protein kinase
MVMIGTTVGKYRVVGLLGRGATGIVYKAIDDTLDREVAIKILNPHFSAPELLKRFHAEATTLAKLSHPEIATIHELLRTETDLMMVMELVRGETLEALIGRVGPMSADLAGHILDGILSALAHAHRAGIVHRDLKPANVMVTELGSIKIMDFGIARVRGTERMTIDGCTVGTPAYMAPEQVLGDDTDGRADLYAVGVILYRLLAGRLPFDADAPLIMLQKQVAETPPALNLFREGLPEWCEPMVQRALSKAPADRFQTAEEFREAVGRATGLAPSIDLAKALAVASENASTTAASNTVAIPETESASPDPPVVATATLSQPSSSEAPTSRQEVRTRRFTPTSRNVAASLMITAVGIAAYFAVGASATGPERSSGGRLANRTPSVDSSPRPGQSSRSASEQNEAYRPVSGASGAPTSTGRPSPAVFETKILLQNGKQYVEEGGRLTLSDGHVNVTPHGTPDDPIFSAAYNDITAIRYTRERAWRPPQKLSRAIRLSDNVLESLRIPERHQVSLHAAAEDRSILLRVEERVVTRLLNALKQRTGRTPEEGRRR